MEKVLKIHENRISERQIFGVGLQPLPEELPQSWINNPYTCPFVLDESCEGIKDPEYKSRCLGDNFNFLNCRIYQGWMNKGIEPVRQISSPLQDTVVMSHDETVKMMGNRGVRTSASASYDSVHDRLADGDDISRYLSFSEIAQIYAEEKHQKRLKKLRQRRHK